jgi:hypothetical protein
LATKAGWLVGTHDQGNHSNHVSGACLAAITGIQQAPCTTARGTAGEHSIAAQLRVVLKSTTCQVPALTRGQAEVAHHHLSL